MSAPVPWREALKLEPGSSDTEFTATVHEGYDVFEIPHGGYLAALAAKAMLLTTDAPDLFTVTTHFLRKALTGPMTFEVTRVGGSRRFTTSTVVARQGDQVVLSAMGSTGDRSTIDGPNWSAWSPPALTDEHLSPEPGPKAPIQAPAIAHRARLRLDRRTLAFAEGTQAENAVLRATADFEPADQLAAIVACDGTPPAIWNVLGSKGWVPTVELTCHVRARPVEGRFAIHVDTRFVSQGFLEEDALVYDRAGNLIVQSRQLARWTS